MSLITLRCRSSSGTQNLSGVDSSQTLSNFKTFLESKTGIPSNFQKILVGFPPSELIASPDTIISTLIKHGDIINVSKSDTEVKQPEKNENQSFLVTNSISSSISSQPQSNPPPKTENDTKDILKSNEPDNSSINMNLGNIEPNFESQADYGKIVRRVVPDDNSCLFHAISYVLEGQKEPNLQSVSRMRNKIAEIILNRSETYTSAMLGKSPLEYSQWIKTSNSWGGAIELSILSDFYRCEIFVLDSVNSIGSCFGQDNGYTKRVYVIFDGIHYDAIAMSPVIDGESMEQIVDLDLTEFSSFDSLVEKKALDFMNKERKEGKYTDTSKFELLCLQCNQILVGEKGAAQHAMATMHSQFVENTKK